MRNRTYSSPFEAEHSDCVITLTNSEINVLEADEMNSIVDRVMQKHLTTWLG